MTVPPYSSARRDVQTLAVVASLSGEGVVAACTSRICPALCKKCSSSSSVSWVSGQHLQFLHAESVHTSVRGRAVQQREHK